MSNIIRLQIEIMPQFCLISPSGLIAYVNSSCLEEEVMEEDEEDGLQKSEELKEGVNNTNSCTCTTTYEYALDLLLIK